jgi:hypothetical protein
MSQKESASELLQTGQPEQHASPDAVTRRRLLYLGLVGGAALVGSNAATGLITHQRTQQRADGELVALGNSYEGQIESVRAELQARITRLEQQLALYRAMDRVGLDRLIALFVDIYDRFWASIRSALQLIRQGVGLAGDAITRFEQALPGLRSAVEILSRLLGDFDARLEGVRRILNELLRRTEPLREAVGGFMAWLIGKIPFGVGVQALTAADRLTDLAASLPSLLTEARERLLAPLQSDWLDAAEDKGLQGGLLQPLREGLLTPLQTHLDDLDRMAVRWDAEFASPLRAALAERDQIRQELARLESAGTVASEPHSESLS